MNGILGECPDGRGGEIGAWVLGALEDHEAVGFGAHLAGCPECQAEAARLQHVVDAIGASSPPARVPPAVRERVMSVVRAEAALVQAAGGADRRLAAPARARRWALPSWGSTRVLGGAAAAAASGLVVGAVALSSTGSAFAKTVHGVTSVPGGAVVLHEFSGHGVLDVSGMKATPPGHVYEVWVLPRGEKTPQPTDSLFGVTRAGKGSVVVNGDLRRIGQVMVTTEPVGGSLHPTTTPFITVRPVE